MSAVVLCAQPDAATQESSVQSRLSLQLVGCPLQTPSALHSSPLVHLSESSHNLPNEDGSLQLTAAASPLASPAPTSAGGAAEEHEMANAQPTIAAAANASLQ